MNSFDDLKLQIDAMSFVILYGFLLFYVLVIFVVVAHMFCNCLWFSKELLIICACFI